MALDPHLRPDPRDLALLVDEERRALDAEVLPPVQVLLLPDAVRLGDAAVDVTQQREIQVILIPELHMAVRVVPAHAEDDRPLRGHAPEVVSEGARFLRAPRRVV